MEIHPELNYPIYNGKNWKTIEDQIGMIANIKKVADENKLTEKDFKVKKFIGIIIIINN